VPYLTPDSIPEDGNCRPLFIPASTDWLAIVSGALTELVKTYNWQQEGAVTVDEAVEAMQLMIDMYYEGCVDNCDVGEGLPPFRLNSQGHVEQLIDGVWQTPTGDYTIPPTPAREEPTPEERRCLAAANAVNVLEQLYESLTESYDEDKTLEEAVGAMIAILAAKFFWVAPIAAGMALLALAAMEIVYLLVEVFTADLWDSDFSDALKCMLYECSLDTGDVVTFDYQCVQEKLQTTLLHIDLNAEQIRLLVQISYILNVIGGVDALNAAGATTEISESDCDGCNDVWCRRWEGSNLPEWEFFPTANFSGGERGEYSGGEWLSTDSTCGGVNCEDPPASSEIMTRILFPIPAHLKRFTVEYEIDQGTHQFFSTSRLIADASNDWYAGGELTTVNSSLLSGGTFQWTGDQDVTTEVTIWMLAAVFSPTTFPTGIYGQITITAIELAGTGENPFGDDNCVA